MPATSAAAPGGAAVGGAATVTLVAPLPKAPVAPRPQGLEASAMRDHLTSYLAGRGGDAKAVAVQAVGSATQAPVSFVCEEDVRAAIAANVKIVIGERTIVTPSARDLAESHRVFVIDGWPRS